MADYTKQEIFDIITEYLEQYGSAVGSYSVHELTPEELTDENLRVLTIPGMRPDTEEWVQTSMANMIQPITHAVSDITILKQQTIAARDGALTATTYAETVNAEVRGMTVRITNRNGQVSTIDVSFDFYKTYNSVAAMNADIANIPKSRLVSIATNDKTSDENARIYQKRSDGTMIYIADLDQASASAWAEWLNTMKPQIQAAITQAASDHARANTDHSTATGDHTTAVTDHTNAVNATNNANTQANRAKGYNDHPWQIGNDGFIYVWNESTQSMVRTDRMILEFNDLTEEQKQSLIDEFYQTLVFATPQETRAMLNELT